MKIQLKQITTTSRHVKNLHVELQYFRLTSSDLVNSHSTKTSCSAKSGQRYPSSCSVTVASTSYTKEAVASLPRHESALFGGIYSWFDRT